LRHVKRNTIRNPAETGKKVFRHAEVQKSDHLGQQSQGNGAIATLSLGHENYARSAPTEQLELAEPRSKRQIVALDVSMQDLCTLIVGWSRVVFCVTMTRKVFVCASRDRARAGRVTAGGYRARKGEGERQQDVSVHLVWPVCIKVRICTRVWLGASVTLPRFN